jgi:FKBP-type peptidyl-prolyl cis-trans isomerase FklB
MKTPIAAVLSAVLLAGTGIGSAGEKPGLKDAKEKISYSVGYEFVDDFKRRGIDLDPDLVSKGIQDALNGAEPRMTSDEMRQVLLELRKKAAADDRKERDEIARKRLDEGEAFLAGNGKKEGVVTLPGGMQYQVIAEGTGRSPSGNDNVTVHYRGTLIDGTEIDSSYRRGSPSTFRLDRVIPGWTQALTRMKEGDKWILFVPANLGYGQRGAGPRIPPNSALIFEVELVSVQPAR